MTLVKTCRLKPAQTGIVRSSLSSLKPMSSAGAFGVRKYGGLFCCPVFDEFRGQNQVQTRVTGLGSGFGDDGTRPRLTELARKQKGSIVDLSQETKDRSDELGQTAVAGDEVLAIAKHFQ